MIVAVVGAVSLAPTARAAQTVVVDFEAGPALNTTPVTDEYLTTSFVRFIREDLGFRPYRRSVVPARARSGSVVVDVGADVCTMEEVGELCEFPGAGTKGRLSRTATSVTVFAGLFRPAGGGRQVTARLVALRADGSEAASSPAVPVNATNFRTPVTVTSAESDIAAFALHAEGPGATGGSALGFDDLTLTFPDNSLPDVSAAIGGGELVLLQGRGLDVPLRLQRLNGSAGPLRLSVSGLPTGITAALVPNPVAGTQDNAVLRLTAPPTAAASFTPFTVTADPQGNGSVGSAVRTAAGMLRVAANFELQAGATGPARLPHCAPVEFPLRVPRSSAFTGVITLNAENLPAGVTADFADDTLGPAGSFVYTPSLRLRRGTGTIPQGATVRVRASSPGAPDRTLLVPVAVATPAATIAGSGTGFAPMRERDGDERTLSGNGFCAGTSVEVGNADASVPATVAADGLSLRFRIPRLASDGPVTVVPPGPGAKYTTGNTLDVRTFRNYYGFQFDNFGWGSLTFAELTDVVGDDELFKRVNPCWPIYDCSVLTPIPNPWALVSWQVMNGLVQASDGHCFGIMRTQQELLAGRVGYDRFTQGADHPYALGSSSGPGSELRHYLDGRHAAQFTKELVAAFLGREKNVNAQVERIRAELQAGRYPGVALMPGAVKTKGHVVTAYDVETVTGGADVYVYDNNTPFRTGESDHAGKETGDSGVIHVRSGRWSFYRGGDEGTWSDSGGTLWAVPLSAIPRDPTLITGLGSLNLSMFVFGSADGAARVASIPSGAEWLPVLDDQAPPMAAGSLVAAGSRPLSHTVSGTKDGSYNELLAATGFTGAVTGVRTGKGVTDRITSKPAARALEFTGTRSRPLEMMVATTTPSGAATRTAIVKTTTAAGGRERAQLTRDGALVYKHQGKATRFSLELSNAGAGRFVSGPLRIADGDRVTADPSDWRSLSKLRLEVRRAGGARLVRTLKARNAAAKIRIGIGRPRILQTARGRELRVKTRLSRVPAGTVGGVVLELVRGGDVVASRAIAVRRVAGGARTDRWRLPKRLGGGRHRVIARISVVSARAGRATATRRATVRLVR